MGRLRIIESIYNFLDVGIYLEIAEHAKKVRFEMGVSAFLNHLFFGKGYKEISPFQLGEKLATQENEPLIVDLREHDRFKKGHICSAILHPFDDFLREIIVEEGYGDYKNRSIILVCDTGQKSRVAASILSDEGFLKVFSLNRGMRRWNRWQKLLSHCGQKQNNKFHICSIIYTKIP